MSRSPGELDEEFAQFVRARQHQLLRAAYLVCGNELKATQVTQAACVFLAVHWSKVKDDVPDTFVRTRLYRDAIGLRHNGTDEVPSLAHLSPKQRAVTVLRHYEQRSERETADILGSSPGSVRSAAHAGDGLDGLLADLAEPVGEQDLVEAARTGARNVRRRRHRLGLGVTVGAALFAAALVVVPRGSTTDRGLPAPAPSSPRPTLTATPPEGDSRTFNLFNVAAEVGPYRPAVDTLPRIDALTRSQLALPEVLSFGPETRLPSLSEVGNNSAPVRAVLLRRTPEGMHPVLVRPTLSKSFMVVDSVTLTPNLDESGNNSEPLEVTAIANDRRHVMFLQPGKVLVLDSFSGKVTTLDVPDSHLEGGGWTSSGESIIAWSRSHQWRLSPTTGVVHRLGQVGANPGSHEVVVDVEGNVRVLEFDGKGNNSRTIGGPPVLSQVWGTTFTNAGGRLATAGFLNQPAEVLANNQRPDEISHAIFTVEGDGTTGARLLLVPNTQGVAAGCCEVLGWAYNDQVLIRWNGTQLLAWNVSTGVLRRVSTLPGPAEGSPMGRAGLTVALAP